MQSAAELVPRPSARVERLEDALAVPGSLCLYSHDGRRIDSTLTWTSQRRLGPAPDRIDPPMVITRITEPVVFGGVFPKPHFGQVLLELFARLWIYDAGHADSTVPIVHHTHRKRPLEPFEQQLLDAALGEPRPPLLPVDRPLLLSEVLVPTQAVVLGQPMLPEVLPLYDRARDRLADGLRPDPRPLHLSRSQARQVRRSTLGESALDERLRRLGVRVVHPESLPLDEQIRLVAGAPTVVGPAGSALHLTVFRDLEGARTISLDRRSPFTKQQHIERLRGADYIQVHARYPIRPRLSAGRMIPTGRYHDGLVASVVARQVAALL